MTVYQIIDDSLTDKYVYGTKEAAALKLFELVSNAKDGSLLNDLLRIYEFEVK